MDSDIKYGPSKLHSDVKDGLRKLQLKPGSLLILQYKEGSADVETLHEISKEVKKICESCTPPIRHMLLPDTVTVIGVESSTVSFLGVPLEVNDKLF